MKPPELKEVKPTVNQGNSPIGDMLSFPAPPSEQEAFVIASLAAQLLPKIELPHGWQYMNHQELYAKLHNHNSILHAPTQGISAGLKPFDQIAGIVVGYARILLARAKRAQVSLNFQKVLRDKNDDTYAKELFSTRPNLESSQASDKMRALLKKDILNTLTPFHTEHWLKSPSRIKNQINE
ncbi:MAG: hypothetical protein RL693_2077 [Verrucomicrobiota bacterium]|jgi:hypothetical protein